MRWQKNNSFVNFGLQSWLATVCKCVVLWAGFPFSLCGGRKKQNKFPSNCTALSTEHQSNQSVFCNYFNLFYCINVSYRFYTCIQRRALSAYPIGLRLVHVIAWLFMFQSTKVSFITDLTSKISLLFNVPSVFITLTLSIVLI